MKIRWLVSLLIMAAASVATAQTPAPTTPPPTSIPRPLSIDWKARPSADDVAAVYPRHASLMGIRGEATMHCSVTAKGTLQGCSVIYENPEGEGFGAAELELARDFRMSPRPRRGCRSLARR